MKSQEAKQLEDIKRLLIALLLKLGASSEEIGAALTVDSSMVRRMIPAKSIKKANFITKSD
jgi:DNA-binding MarR family transcriptional regulator